MEEDAAMQQQLAYAQGLQFPWRLHVLLEQAEKRGQGHIVSWLPDGKSFRVYDKQEFASLTMPTFFSSSTYKTFQRNLNLWGFHTVSKGPDKGVCTHHCFVRGMPQLCSQMKRVRVKGGANEQHPPASHGHSHSEEETQGALPNEDPRVELGAASLATSTSTNEHQTTRTTTPIAIRSASTTSPMAATKTIQMPAIVRPAPNAVAAAPLMQPITQSLQPSMNGNLQLLHEIAARCPGTFALGASGSSTQHARLMQAQSMLTQADVLARHINNRNRLQRMDEPSFPRLSVAIPTPMSSNHPSQPPKVEPILYQPTTAVPTIPQERVPYYRRDGEGEDGTKSTMPCRARAMPMDHNCHTAYFTQRTTNNTNTNNTHGSELVCSHLVCRKDGIKFLYCSHCGVPVAKKSFWSRHRHDEDEEEQHVAAAAAPTNLLSTKRDRSGVPSQVTTTATTTSGSTTKKKRDARSSPTHPLQQQDTFKKGRTNSLSSSSSSPQERHSMSDTRRNLPPAGVLVNNNNNNAEQTDSDAENRVSCPDGSSSSSGQSSPNSRSQEESSSSAIGGRQHNPTGTRRITSPLDTGDDAQRRIAKSWERLLFQRPRSDSSDEMSAWLMTVLSVSATFKWGGFRDHGRPRQRNPHDPDDHSSSSNMSILSSNDDSSSSSSQQQ